MRPIHWTNHRAFYYLVQLNDLRENFNGIITFDECKQKFTFDRIYAKGTVLSMYQNNWIMSLKSKRKFNSGKQDIWSCNTKTVLVYYLMKDSYCCRILLPNQRLYSKNKHQNYSIGNITLHIPLILMLKLCVRKKMLFGSKRPLWNFSLKCKNSGNWCR